MKKPYSTFLLILAGLIFSLRLSAQAPTSKEVTHFKLAWFDLMENVKIRDKWLLQAEVTERFFIDPSEHFNVGARVYGLYNVGEGWSMGPGFSVWFPQTQGIKTHELRPAQQFLYRQKMEKRTRLGFAHRFVIEERLVRNVVNSEIVDGYTFFMRFRYRFAFDYTVAKLGAKERPLKLLLNDEIFLQGGETVITNVFDQNRMFAGVSAMFAKGTTVTLCYGNLFRPTRNPGKFDDIHIIRVFFTHEFSIGKKKD